MNVNFDNKDKGSNEIFLLVVIIGALDMVSQKVISIKDVSRYLFNPYSLQVLEDNQIDKKIIEFVERGCLFEDYESVWPHLLDDEIRALKKEASELLKLKKTDKKRPRWL